MMKLPHFLLIAGEQQNVGKTTLACKIIAHFSREKEVFGLKVTPHFHKSLGNAQGVITDKKYELLEEKSPEGNKDTARMLQSGAAKAFLLQAEPEGIASGIESFLNLLPKNALVVCESAGVREHVEPGIFLVVRQLNCKICSIEDENIFSLADRIITYTVNGFDFAISDLLIEDGKWNLKKNNE